MGDVGDTFNALREHRKQKRWANRASNDRAMAATTVPYTTTNNGECLLFREPGRPAADFYPSTGRWRCNGRTYNGGARAFLRWYAKQHQQGGKYG